MRLNCWAKNRRERHNHCPHDWTAACRDTYLSSSVAGALGRSVYHCIIVDSAQLNRQASNDKLLGSPGDKEVIASDAM